MPIVGENTGTALFFTTGDFATGTSWEYNMRPGGKYLKTTLSSVHTTPRSDIDSYIFRVRRRLPDGRDEVIDLPPNTVHYFNHNISSVVFVSRVIHGFGLGTYVVEHWE